MTVPSVKFSLEPKTLSELMDSYAELVKVVGKKTSKTIDFIAALTIMNSQIGFDLGEILDSFGILNCLSRINLTLKLDKWTRRIPWELAMLPDRPELFLCERINIGRAMDVDFANQWKLAPNKMKNESFKALVVGLNYKKNSRSTPLDYSEADAKAVHAYLTKFSKSKKEKNLMVLPKLIGGNARKTRLEKRFTEGITLFHFSGHGSLNEDVGRITLALNKHLTVKNLCDVLDKANVRAPTFSFMNACETCLQKQIRGDVYDWAHVMANHGSRALIGTFWSVMDKDATAFSLAFYRNFFQVGKTIGESVRLARLYVKKNSDNDDYYTWPAFVLYGPPNLKAKDVLV